jgi:hypothetical protein
MSHTRTMLPDYATQDDSDQNDVTVQCTSFSSTIYGPNWMSLRSRREANINENRNVVQIAEVPLILFALVQSSPSSC